MRDIQIINHYRPKRVIVDAAPEDVQVIEETPATTKECIISDSVYSALAIDLLESIGRSEYFKGDIPCDKVAGVLSATLIVYRKATHAPDDCGSSEINDIVPVWWEFHTYDENGEETKNDFQFSELKKFIG